MRDHEAPATLHDRTGRSEPATPVLVHTGLRVPHTRLTTHHLDHFEVGSAVGYSALLRLDGRPVGHIVNPYAIIALYRPLPGSPFGHDAMCDYARRCRDDH